MKRIGIYCLLSSCLLQAAPVIEKKAEKRKIEISLEDVKKISNQRNQQLLADLTRITLGIGCLVASGIAFRNCYTAYKKCDEKYSLSSIGSRLVNDVDLKVAAAYVAKGAVSVTASAKSYTTAAWEKTKSGASYAGSSIKSGALYAGSSIWSGVAYAWNALPNPRKVKLFGASTPTRSTPSPIPADPVPADPAPILEPVPLRPATPPPASPAPTSPRFTRNSPVKDIFTQDSVVNYAKAVGWGTAGLISGIVGVRLIMKGLHIELSKAKKTEKTDKKKIEVDIETDLEEA